MFRGTTVRAVVSVLATAALALLLFAPTASFASAHTFSEAQAKAVPGTTPPDAFPGPGNTPAGQALRDETASCRAAHHGDPTGPLRTRARSHPAGRAPSASGRPLPPHVTPATAEPARHSTAHTSRPPVPHAPATLQVFRC
ncbi:hypothetical protein [Streptomyces djakartensis]|uniref:hypothetical protein n=1 Tax=Streptomyces djakartensis TaxID=68193 RepID=UPI0034DF2611